MSSSKQKNICLKCSAKMEDSFCAECGQPASIQKFDWSYLWSSLLRSFDLQRGVLHTVMLFATGPGQALRGYIEGRRVGFSNPFKLFLVIGTLVTLLSLETGVYSSSQDKVANLEGARFIQYATKYFTFFALMSVPILSLGSFLIFLRHELNYVEHFILNLYTVVGQFLVVIVILVVGFWLKQEVPLLVITIAVITYQIWTFGEFFGNRSLPQWISTALSVAVVQTITAAFNYWSFQFYPDEMWAYLDRFLG